MAAVIEPILRKWTKREYHAAADLGWFDNERVELIDGEVIRMAAQKDGHAVSLTLTEEAVRQAFGTGCTYRVQMPMDFGSKSEPEPDLAVIRGLPRSVRRHPSMALLLVEISDTTLLYDRTRKSRLYASRGIRDYWIVDLVHRKLEVRRRPTADEKEPFGFTYLETKVFLPGESVAPLGARRAKIKVADLLP